MNRRRIVVVSAGLGQPSSTRLLADRLTGFPSAALGKAVDSMLTADGLVVVSPVLNASYSGLFKMFFAATDDWGSAGDLVDRIDRAAADLLARR